MATAHDPVAFAAAMSGRLDWTQDDLYDWSLRMAERCVNARAVVTDDVFTGVQPTGKTPEAALARAYDPAFWRRQGALAVKRAHSTYAQHSKSVGGSTGRAYVSTTNATWFKDSRERQAQWAQSCVLVDVATRSEKVPLAQVMNTPERLWAKTYAFIKGLQLVATKDHGYKWFMATITLPSHYHANPVLGANSWSGATVKEGFDELMRGINRMGAWLAKHGIRKLGIGSEEPQQDETPHLHEGIFYADDDAFWRYLEGYGLEFGFPVKVIHGVKAKRAVVFRNMHAVRSRKGVHAVVGSPGRVTITVGAKGAAAFASYMAKYVSKNSGAQLASDDDNHASATAVLAHRNAQGIRGWRFYGLPEGALSGWDELRRVDEDVAKPSHPALCALMSHAKAGKADSFIRCLGGLRVEAKPAAWLGLRMMTAERTNRYGESSKRTVGVQLLQLTRDRRKVPTGKTTKRGRPQVRTRTVVEATVLDSVLTRFREWEVLTKAQAVGLSEFTDDAYRAVGVPPNYPRGACEGEDAQRRAIRAPVNESTVVLSSAGSGKTHVLTERARHLVGHGVRPKDILITTYTREAAKELEQRLLRIL